MQVHCIARDKMKKYWLCVHVYSDSSAGMNMVFFE